MIASDRRLVVLGVGNVLRGDDAVGVRVVEALRAAVAADPSALPGRAVLVDGGTQGLELLDWVRGSAGLVLVDAMTRGGPAGRVWRLPATDLDAAGGTGHPVGDLLATARLLGWLPPSVSLVGIEAAAMDPGMGLSPAVAGAVPAAAAAVRTEVRRMHERSSTGGAGCAATHRLAGATA